MERKLASIQRIIDIQPIPNADAIEVATVLGWHVVIKKGEFKKGELVVYCEIDSILPPRPEFDFLADSKYRIRTIKLRGQVSQGIIFPFSVLPTPTETHYGEGDDVTSILGITKYEMPIPAQLAGKVRGGFPGFLPKTDETRIQAFPQVLERHRFYATEKLDGSSTSFVIFNGEFHVCSRNLDLLDDGVNTIWRVAKEMKIEEKLRSLEKEGICLQGEIVGEGIQGNKYKLKGQSIYFFNAFEVRERRYYDFEEFLLLLRALDLPMVPVTDYSYSLPKTVDELVGYVVDRPSVLCADTPIEGLVFRPRKESIDADLGRLSFKVINPNFLLKYKE